MLAERRQRDRHQPHDEAGGYSDDRACTGVMRTCGAENEYHS